MLLTRLRKRWKKSALWLKGWWAVNIRLRSHQLLQKPIVDITRFQRSVPFIERREFSQNGEDGIIEAIIGMVGVTNRYCVEFGVEDGTECNVRYLLKKRGWTGLLMDGGHEDPHINLHKEFITAENIEELFRKHSVPEKFDLLSIDIDGNDYWVWKAITHYHPRIVIIEYNAHIPPEIAETIPYNPAFVWDKTDYYGASLLALKSLGETKGYTLLGTDKNGVNAFFIQSSLMPGRFAPPLWPGTYHPPTFKGKPGNRHPPDPQKRPWIRV